MFVILSKDSLLFFVILRLGGLDFSSRTACHSGSGGCEQSNIVCPRCSLFKLHTFESSTLHGMKNDWQNRLQHGTVPCIDSLKGHTEEKPVYLTPMIIFSQYHDDECISMYLVTYKSVGATGTLYHISGQKGGLEQQALLSGGLDRRTPNKVGNSQKQVSISGTYYVTLECADRTLERFSFITH